MTSNGGARAKQKRQLFPEKLWELVNSQQGSGIRWSPSDSKCIEIERAKLERYLQTKFRSQNFDSFIRQLHFYGFKKCGNSYYHDKFQRDQPDRIHFMRRKYSQMLLSTASNQHKPASNSTPSSKVASSPVKLAGNDINNNNSNSNNGSGSGSGGIHKNGNIEQDRPQSTDSLDGLEMISTPVLKPKLKSRPGKEIKLYTVDATSVGDVMGNFTNVRETSARAIKSSEGHVKINIPKSLVNLAGASGEQVGPWPRSLVLECYKDGQQSVLSAFFVYRLD